MHRNAFAASRRDSLVSNEGRVNNLSGRIAREIIYLYYGLVILVSVVAPVAVPPEEAA